MEASNIQAGKLPNNFTIESISEKEIKILNNTILKETAKEPIITLIMVPDVDNKDAMDKLPEEERLKMKNRYQEIVEAADVVSDMNDVSKVLKIRYFPGQDNEILNKDLYYISEFVNKLKTQKVEIKIIAPFTSLYNKGQVSVADTFVFEDAKLRKGNFQKIANMLNTIKPSVSIDWITCQSGFFKDILEQAITKPDVKVKLYNGFLYNLVYYFRIKEDSAEWKIIQSELQNPKKLTSEELANKYYTAQDLQKKGLNTEGLIKEKFKNMNTLPDYVKLKNGKYIIPKENLSDLKFSLKEVIDFISNRETKKAGSKDAGKFVTGIIDHRKLVTVSEDVKKDQAIKFNITFDGHQLPLFAEEWSKYSVKPEFEIVAPKVENSLSFRRSKSLDLNAKN
jgi:hypothetical protein